MKTTRFWPLYILLLSGMFLPWSVQATRTVLVEGPHAQLEYGEYRRGDVFSDTLFFSIVSEGQNDPSPLTLEDVEITCDCITASILEDGSLEFTYHVEEGEEDGKVEKILYLFTDRVDMDVVRLVITITVLSAADNPQGIPDQIAGEDVFSPEDIISAIDCNPDVLLIFYFYSPGCPSCREVKDGLIPDVEKKWDDQVIVLPINIDHAAGYAQLLEMRRAYDVQDRRSPFSFFVGKSVVLGRGGLEKRLDEAISQALQTGEHTIIPSESNRSIAVESAKDVFKSFTFWTVLGAGLIDGINPCAFATIVFFISLLNYAGSTRKQVMAVGLGFTVSVFAVYLLLGLGAFHTLELFSRNLLIQQIIYGIALLMVLVLFVLSLLDTIKYYRSGGETRSQVLQLSKKSKQRIHRVMRKGLVTGSLFLGALGIGALVSLFEAACTGQVYLPTIVLVLQDEAMRGHAIIYLFLYNLMFILPLVVVFSLAYSGVASEKLTTWSREHFGLTRVLMSLLFLLLAVMMVVVMM